MGDSLRTGMNVETRPLREAAKELVDAIDEGRPFTNKVLRVRAALATTDTEGGLREDGLCRWPYENNGETTYCGLYRGHPEGGVQYGHHFVAAAVLPALAAGEPDWLKVHAEGPGHHYSLDDCRAALRATTDSADSDTAPLDVERLARAIVAANEYEFIEDGRREASRIAAEYARLAASTPETPEHQEGTR